MKSREKEKLKAGFGMGEIEFPQEIFPVEGFIGVHDNPCVRLMLLETGEERLVIASVELVNVPPAGIALCKDVIAEITGTAAERIWVHITHAISTMHEPGRTGPVNAAPSMEERRKKQRELFYAALRTAVVHAAGQVSKNFGEVRIGWGTGVCDVSVNRDVETPFGWWTGHDPDGPSDKKMTVLRVEDREGTPKGFFISYGIKPCAIDNAGMEEGVRLVSADVCGTCSRIMETRFGVPALFCVSAAADQVSQRQAWWQTVDAYGNSAVKDLGVKQGLAFVEEFGNRMGQDAVNIAETIDCAETEGSIRHCRFSFTWKKKAGKRTGPMQPPKAFPEEGECEVEGEIFTLGNGAFVAEKPEINCVTGKELSRRSPFAHTCLICMVNGEMKYMPDRTAYVRNTFECQSSMLQPGAAEEFVDRAEELLKGLFEEAMGV